MQGGSLTGCTLRFSLVVATIGRTHQLARLLESLKKQTYKNFEVILVDQNPPGFLDEIIAPFQECLSIAQLRSEVGLSSARNVGLGHVTGDVVAFPDDDCWYSSDVLSSAANLLTKHPNWDGLTGRLVDPDEPAGFPWYHTSSGPITLNNLWHRSISVTIFLRKDTVVSVGKFDRNLGRGATTGMCAAEESEYLIRALKQGFKLHYSADLSVYHEWLPNHHAQLRELAFGGGFAFGYVLRKHDYPLLFVIRTWVRALGGAVHALFYGSWPRLDFYQATLRGRVLGWFSGECRNENLVKELAVDHARFREPETELPESLRLEHARSYSEAQVSST